MTIHFTVFSYEDLISFISNLGNIKGWAAFRVYQIDTKTSNVYEIELTGKI